LECGAEDPYAAVVVDVAQNGHDKDLLTEFHRFENGIHEGGGVQPSELVNRIRPKVVMPPGVAPMDTS
jgi:hypothetical protein